MDDTFEDYWEEVCRYAKKLGVSPQYIEEEFIIEGELIKLDPKFTSPKPKTTL